jgi:hypothetical protein
MKKVDLDLLRQRESGRLGFFLDFMDLNRSLLGLIVLFRSPLSGPSLLLVNGWTFFYRFNFGHYINYNGNLEGIEIWYRVGNLLDQMGSNLKAALQR